MVDGLPFAGLQQRTALAGSAVRSECMSECESGSWG